MLKEYLKVFITSIKRMKYFLVFFFVYILVCKIAKIEVCIYKNLFGYPCPACGITRAWISFFTLDIKKAFYYHPLFLFLPLVLMVYIFKERPFWKRINDSKIFWISILASIIICYIIRMCIYF